MLFSISQWFMFILTKINRIWICFDYLYWCRRFLFTRPLLTTLPGAVQSSRWLRRITPTLRRRTNNFNRILLQVSIFILNRIRQFFNSSFLVPARSWKPSVVPRLLLHLSRHFSNDRHLRWRHRRPCNLPH